MRGAAVISTWWSAAVGLLTIFAPPTAARRRHHHGSNGSQLLWGSAGHLFRGEGCAGKFHAAFALPRSSTLVVCSSPRRHGGGLDGATRVCGGRWSHVRCRGDSSRNGVDGRSAGAIQDMGCGGVGSGCMKESVPSLLLYGAAMRWWSSSILRAGQLPIMMASSQSAHEAAMDNSRGSRSGIGSVRLHGSSSATSVSAVDPAAVGSTHTAVVSSFSPLDLGTNQDPEKPRSKRKKAMPALPSPLDKGVEANGEAAAPAEEIPSTDSRRTANGGFAHTNLSRRRISIANKGKTPWNKGGSHSESTRKKIADGAKMAALKRKMKLAEEVVSETGVQSV